MPLASIVLVTLSGLVHAVWNLWAKRSESPLVFLWSFQWVAVAVYGPFGAFSLAANPPPAAGLLWLLLTVALHGAYVLLLARSYAMTDFSQSYPLQRGVPPLLIPLLGVSLLGEHLPPVGWIGVFLIVFGVALVGGGRSLSFGRRPALYLGLAVGLAIAAYTLVDKVTLHYLSPIALNACTSAGNLAVLTLPALRTGDARSAWREAPWLVIGAGILSTLSYLLFLYALNQGSAAAVAPMRSVGIVFGALLGVLLLREPQGPRRVAGAGLITLGTVLLGIGA